MIEARDNKKQPLLSEVPPSAVFKAAASLVEELKRLTTSDPKKAEHMLLGAWQCVEEELHKLIQHPATPIPEASVMSAMIFLREYFRHAGDWDAMKDCLKNGASAGSVTVVAIKVGGDTA